MYQTQQSIIITAGDGETHMTISWRIHRVYWWNKLHE